MKDILIHTVWLSMSLMAVSFGSYALGDDKTNRLQATMGLEELDAELAKAAAEANAIWEAYKKIEAQQAARPPVTRAAPTPPPVEVTVPVDPLTSTKFLELGALDAAQPLAQTSALESILKKANAIKAKIITPKKTRIVASKPAHKPGLSVVAWGVIKQNIPVDLNLKPFMHQTLLEQQGIGVATTVPLYVMGSMTLFRVTENIPVDLNKVVLPERYQTEFVLPRGPIIDLKIPAQVIAAEKILRYTEGLPLPRGPLLNVKSQAATTVSAIQPPVVLWHLKYLSPLGQVLSTNRSFPTDLGSLNQRVAENLPKFDFHPEAEEELN